MQLDRLLHKNFMQRHRGRLLFNPDSVESGGERLANLAWQKSTQLSTADLENLPLTQLLSPLPMREGEVELEIRSADGWQTRSCQVRAYDNWFEVILSERADGSLGPAELADRLKTILRITTDLRGRGEVEELINEIGINCKRITRASRTTIFITNPDKTLIPIYTDDEEYRDAILSMKVAKGTGLTGHVVNTGLPEIINDPMNSPIVKQIPGTPEVEEVLLSVPLVSADRVMGAITLSRECARPFINSDLEIMSIMAHQVTEILAEQELIGKLAESELKFRSLVRNAEVGLFRLDLLGNILEINPFACRLFAIPEGDTPQIQDIWGSEDTHKRFLTEINQRGRITNFECRSLARNGRLLELEFNGRLFAEMGYIEGVLHDKTEQKRHETESRNRLNFLDNLISQTPQALLILKPDGTLVRLNSHFEETFEVSERELILASSGHSPLDRMCEILPELSGIWQSCLSGKQHSEEGLRVLQSHFKNREKDLYLALTAFPVHNQIGNLTEIVFQFQDVSRRMNLQRQLIRAQKLESIGSLAGGFAHDFKNILAGILGNANYLKIKMSDNEEAIRIAETIERATGKADNLTRQLLGMARQATEEKKPVDVNKLVEQGLLLLSRGISKQVHLVTQLASDLPLIEADPEEIEQVLLNLVLNSADAIGDKGEIKINTRLRYLNPATFQSSSEGKPFVELEVRDTGHGIPDELQVKIFDPFFTTKPEGKGTGLGLAMVDGIIRSHGGRVELASRVGVGTRFRILLPATPGLDSQSRIESTTTFELSPGNEHILIIDDEDVIRDMIARMLENMGYKATACSTGSEGLARYQENPAEINLVILDMMMPEMNGLEVYERLVAIDPDVKILICSGYSDQDSSSLLDMPAIHGFLQKPFSITTFSQSIRRILDASE